MFSQCLYYKYYVDVIIYGIHSHDHIRHNSYRLRDTAVTSFSVSSFKSQFDAFLVTDWYIVQFRPFMFLFLFWRDIVVSS